MPVTRAKQAKNLANTGNQIATDHSRTLPLDLVLRAFAFLPANEIACTARLTCKEANTHFSSPSHRVVCLSQPVPPHAFAARYVRGAGPVALSELSFKRKEKLFVLTAASGVLDNVATLVERMEPPFWWALPGYKRQNACVAAARRGHMHVVRWLLERHYEQPNGYDPEATAAAVMQHCSLADTQWLLAQEPYRAVHIPRELAFSAVDSTTPDTNAKREWVLARGHVSEGELDRLAVLAAARSGDQLTLQRAMEGASAGLVPGEVSGHHLDVLCSAACSGAAGVVRWLLEQPWLRQSAIPIAAVRAATGGHLATLELLLPDAFRLAGNMQWVAHQCLACVRYHGHANIIRLVWEQAEARALDMQQHFNRAIKDVAGVGSVEAAAWLWQRRPQQLPAGALEEAVRAAAACGSVAMLTFLREEVGAPWGQDMMGGVLSCAGSGRDCLPVLRWLHERGCPLECSAEVLDEFVELGEVEVVEWLQEKGLVSREQLANEELLQSAVRGGCGAMVEWLVAAGCPTGRVGMPYIAAGRNGDLDTLRCLRRLGVPMGRHVLERAVAERLSAHAVRWMVEEGGAACSRQVAERAAKQYAGAEGAAVREWLRRAAGLHGKKR